MNRLFSRSNFLYTCLTIFSIFGFLLCAKTIFSYRSVGSDYVQDYLAAHALRNQSSLYSEYHGEESKASPFQQYQSPILNVHPPAYTLLLFPLSYLKYQCAFVVLGFLSLSSLLGSLFFFQHEFKFSVKLFWIIVAAALVHPSVHACLATGNLSLILVFIIILVWSLLRRDFDYLAGALLAIATSLKLFPGILILAFFLTGRVKALTGFTAVFCVIFVLALLITGVEDLIAYAFVVLPANSGQYINHAFNLSIAGAIYRVIGSCNEWSPWLGGLALMPGLALIITVFLSITILLVTCYSIIRTPREKRNINEVFSLFLICMLFLSPLTWIHIFPVLIIPLGLILQNYVQHAKKGGLNLLLIIILFLS